MEAVVFRWVKTKIVLLVGVACYQLDLTMRAYNRCMEIPTTTT